MSGRKTVRVDAEHLAKLEKAKDRLADVRRDLPVLLDGVLSQARSELNEGLRAVNARQQRFDRALDRLSDRAAAFERQTTQRLADQERRIDEDRQYLESAIAQERAIRSQQVEQLNVELAGLKDKSAEAARLARGWLDDATTLHDAIRDTLPHERFAPRRLPAVHDQLAGARSTLDAGQPEASLGLAQTAFHELDVIRSTVELLDHEWRLAQAEAREKLLTVQTIAEGNRTRTVVDAEGTEVPGATINVDLWSRGRLTQIEQEVQRLLAETAEHATTVERLRAVAALAEQLETDIAGTVADAGVAILAAQQRADVVRTIAATLARNGYSAPVQQVLEQGDPLRGLFVKVRHPDASEIVIQVSPAEADATGMAITIDSFDTDTDAEEIRQLRMDEIMDQLKEHGIRVGEQERVSDQPDERVRDFDTIGTPLSDPQRTRVNRPAS